MAGGGLSCAAGGMCARKSGSERAISFLAPAKYEDEEEEKHQQQKADADNDEEDEEETGWILGTIYG